VLSNYKHRQDFRRGIPVAVDKGMWELSRPPSALRHALLLLRMAPTQTGLCPLPAASSSFPHPELEEAMFLKGCNSPSLAFLFK